MSSYQMRQRRPREAAAHRGDNSDTQTKRNLRRRRPSLRYTEDDSQSETTDLLVNTSAQELLKFVLHLL